MASFGPEAVALERAYLEGRITREEFQRKAAELGDAARVRPSEPRSVSDPDAIDPFGKERKLRQVEERTDKIREEAAQAQGRTSRQSLSDLVAEEERQGRRQLFGMFDLDPENASRLEDLQARSERLRDLAIPSAVEPSDRIKGLAEAAFTRSRIKGQEDAAGRTLPGEILEKTLQRPDLADLVDLPARKLAEVPVVGEAIALEADLAHRLRTGEARARDERPEELALRAAGLMSALVQETGAEVKRALLPEGSPQEKARKAFAEGVTGPIVGALGQDRAFDPLSVADLPDEVRGLTDSQAGATPIQRVLTRSMEKVRRGQGLEEDFRAGFADQLGEEWANVGWWVGLGGEIALPWEAPLGAVPKAAKVANAASKLQDIAGGTMKGRDFATAFGAALRGQEFRYVDLLTDEWARAYAKGEATIDDLPAKWRALVDEMAVDSDIDPAALRQGRPAGPEDLARGPEAPEGPPPVPPELLQASGGATIVPPAPRRRPREAPLGDGEGSGPGEGPGEGPGPGQGPGEGPGGGIPGPPDPGLPEMGPLNPVEAAIQAKPRSTNEFYDFLRGMGPNVRIGEGQGYRALAWLDGGRGPKDPMYQLRGVDGRMVAEGDLETVARLAAKRRLPGDRVTRGTRPVVGWRVSARGEKKAGELVGNRRFASKEERAVADAVRAEGGGIDPDVMAEFRRRVADAVRAEGGGISPDVMAEFRRRGAEQVDHLGLPVDPERILGALGRMMGMGLAPKAAPPLMTAGQEVVTQLVRDAGRAQAVRAVGSDRLVMVGPRTWLPKRDAERAVGGVKRLQREVGLDPTGIRAPKEGRLSIPNPDALRRFAKAVDRGIDIADDGTIDAKDWNALIDGAFATVAGRWSNAKYSFEGMGSVGDAIRKELVVAGETRPLLGSAVSSFIEVNRARWPKSTARIMNELERTMTRVVPDLQREARRLRSERVPDEEILPSLVRSHQPITPPEISALRTVRAALADKASADVLRAEVRRQMPGHVPPHLAGIDSDDPAQVVRAAGKWAAETRARLQREFALIAKAHYPDFDLLPMSGTGRRLADTPPEAIEDFLIRFYEDPAGAGQEVERIIGFGARSPVTTGQAMYNYLINMRLEGMFKSAVRRLADEGLGLDSTAEVRDTAVAILTGASSTVDSLKRTAHITDEPTYAEAMRFVRRWGLEGGAPSDVDVIDDIALPKTVVAELRRLVDRGLIGESDVFTGKGWGSKVANELYRNGKMYVTSGFILPNMGFHVGAAVGMLPQMMLTIGPRKTVSAAGAFVGHGRMVGQLVKRLSGYEHVFQASSLDGQVLRTASGRIYDVGALEDLARQHGVDLTRQSAEMAEHFVADLERGAEGLLSAGWRRIHGINNILKEFAEGVERAGRLSAFIAELKADKAPAEAAEVARASLLEYGRLTDFERHKMRAFFLFYTFMRKNSDATMKALVENPSLVLGQMRAAREQPEAWGLSDLEQAQLRPDDYSRAFAAAWESERSTEGKVVGATTGVLSAAEAVFLWMNLLGAPRGAVAGKGTEARQPLEEIAGELAPFPALFVEAAGGTVPGTNLRLGDEYLEMVPPYFAEWPMRPLLAGFGGELEQRVTKSGAGEMAGQRAGWFFRNKSFGLAWRVLQKGTLLDRATGSTARDLMAVIGHYSGSTELPPEQAKDATLRLFGLSTRRLQSDLRATDANIEQRTREAIRRQRETRDIIR